MGFSAVCDCGIPHHTHLLFKKDNTAVSCFMEAYPGASNMFLEAVAYTTVLLHLKWNTVVRF